jgi:four helix bundle protein
LRRAVVSIPSNIAEGYGRKTTQQYIYGLDLAYGSLCELETQLMLCCDLGYLSEGGHRKLQIDIEEIGRMLKALIKSLESLHRSSQKKLPRFIALNP